MDSTHLYWVNNRTDSIGTANLAGKDVNQMLISGASGPAGVAVSG